MSFGPDESGEVSKRSVGATGCAVEKTVGGALARAGRARRNHLGALLADLGLHAGQEMVLVELFREDGLRVGKLACRLGVEPPTATKMVVRLESSGLVERRRDPEDARCGRVTLTRKGESFRAPLQEIWRQSEEEMLVGISEEEREELVEMLEKIRRNLESRES